MRNVAITLAKLCFCASALFGQARGTINGRITDMTGATVPQAKVTATNADTGVVRTSESNSDGLYNLPALDPGTYNIKVERSGFTPTAKSVAGSLQTSEVQNLPMLNRNFTGLVSLVPGARPAPVYNATKADDTHW